MKDKISEIRRILRKPFEPNLQKFVLLKDVADLPSAQDLVLRVFARRPEFEDFHELVVELIRQVGLYPYLKDEELSLRDLLAFEMHRVEGMNEVIFHSSQAKVYNHLMNGKCDSKCSD